MLVHGVLFKQTRNPGKSSIGGHARRSAPEQLLPVTTAYDRGWAQVCAVADDDGRQGKHHAKSLSLCQYFCKHSKTSKVCSQCRLEVKSCVIRERTQSPHQFPPGSVMEDSSMPTIHPFFSVNEEKKPREERVYHNNAKCKVGRGIPVWDRHQGTNSYELCPVCAGLVGD
jgi:hypothetical protein